MMILRDGEDEGVDMGLAERRVIEEFKKGGYATFLTQINTITGMNINVETQWDDLARQVEGRSNLREDFNDYFDNLFGKTIVGVLTSVCADDMGKEALVGALKKVIIKSDNEARSSATGFSFNDGQLILNMTYSNTDDVDERTREMIKLVESKL